MEKEMTMSFAEKTAVFAFAALCAGSVVPAFAQAPATPAQAPAAAPAAPVDEEEAFDEKLREFGYWSGAAHGCVAEAKQPEVERKVLETFNRIGQLFGTDRAFFYAAAFGHRYEMNWLFRAATSGSCRKSMNRCARSAAFAPFRMTRSSQAMDSPSRGARNTMSGFSARAWRMSPL